MTYLWRRGDGETIERSGWGTVQEATTRAEAPVVQKKRWEPSPKTFAPLVETDEYEALCDTLGYLPTEIAVARSLRPFLENHIPIYDKDEVSHFMTSICPEDKIWGWAALGHQAPHNRYANCNGCELGGAYTKLVPIHILKRIKVVKDLLKDTDPKFYVTDYAVPDPDPFVKVVFGGGHEVIFGKWDEPGFGDLKTIVE